MSLALCVVIISLFFYQSRLLVIMAFCWLVFYFGSLRADIIVFASFFFTLVVLQMERIQTLGVYSHGRFATYDCVLNSLDSFSILGLTIGASPCNYFGYWHSSLLTAAEYFGWIGGVWLLSGLAIGLVRKIFARDKLKSCGFACALSWSFVEGGVEWIVPFFAFSLFAISSNRIEKLQSYLKL